MITSYYHNHLESQLDRSDYLLLTILIQLLQSIKQVKLESLASALPLPILFESRRKKLQRFLSLPALTIKNIWFPMISHWLPENIPAEQVVYIAIDRTNWGWINLLTVSIIWEGRAFPLYWELLSKKGSSNFTEQTRVISQVLPLFSQYRIVILGDREFCSIQLGNWLRQQEVYFCLRLKRNEYIQQEDEIYVQLNSLGLAPGTQFFLQGVKVTQKNGFAPLNVACKWKGKYRGSHPKEGWFILTNLKNLQVATLAYSKRFGIEEMFRDFKKGGYSLEDTNVTGERFVALVLLIAIAYINATIQGKEIKKMGMQKYIGRVKEPGRQQKRHSSFYIGLYAHSWVNFIDHCAEAVAELILCTRNKWHFFRKGLRAMELILSTL